MEFEDNNGTTQYTLSCGIPSDVDWDADPNNGSRYYYLSANDYILWCQDDFVYPPVTSNNDSEYYFLYCALSGDSGDFTDNNGTKFYYSSAFNDVSFCE